MTRTPALQILFICTGNICRSPLAAQLLESELLQRSDGAGRRAVLADPVRVFSRGTNARVGEPMEGHSARQSRALGGDPAEHIALQLSAADLDAADLIVTMTLEQRAFAARLRPAASKKAVTLLEFARLLDHGWSEDTDGRSATQRERLALLLGKRSMVPPPRRDDELVIPDPYGRSSGTHTKVARQIQASIESLAAWLAAGAVAQPAGTVAQPPPAEEPEARLTRRRLHDLRGGALSMGERPSGSEPGKHAQ